MSEAESIYFSVEPDGDGDAVEAAEELQRIFNELREAGLDVEQIQEEPPPGAKGGVVSQIVAVVNNVGIELVAALLVARLERTGVPSKLWAKVRGRDGKEMKKVDLSGLTREEIISALQAS